MSHVAYICISNITRVTIVRLFLFEELYLQRPYSNTDVRITNIRQFSLPYVLIFRYLRSRSGTPVISITFVPVGGCSLAPLYDTPAAPTTSSIHYRKRSQTDKYGLPYTSFCSLLAIVHSSPPWSCSVLSSTHPPRTPRLRFAVTRPPCAAAAASNLTPNKPRFRAFFCAVVLKFNNVSFSVCCLLL